jgi:hypothetical protein
MRSQRRSMVDTAARPDYKPALGAGSRSAQVAQLVEHATENRSVGGSIPPLGTIFSNDFNTIDKRSGRAISSASIRGINLGNKSSCSLGRRLTANSSSISRLKCTAANHTCRTNCR